MKWCSRYFNMEWCKSDCGQYRVENLSASTITGALHVIKEAFCKDELVCIGAEVNISPVATEELLELCADAALDGVSLVAIHIATGEVVSVAFNKLHVAPSSLTEKPFFEIFAQERCTVEASKSLVFFMADVDGRCNLFEKHNADCCLEIMFLATLREHRRKGLAKLLCQFSEKLASKLKEGPVSKITVEDLGPKYTHLKPRDVSHMVPKICQAIWTSYKSQNIGKALGFNVDVKVSYEEYKHNGKTYAERIGPETPFCELVSKKVV